MRADGVHTASTTPGFDCPPAVLPKTDTHPVGCAITKLIRRQRRPVPAQFANRRPRTVVTIGYRLVRLRDAAAAGR
jgi:hypothetical protein